MERYFYLKIPQEAVLALKNEGDLGKSIYKAILHTECTKEDTPVGVNGAERLTITVNPNRY